MTLTCEKGCGKCCEVNGTTKVLMTTRDEAERIATFTGRPMNTSAGRPMHLVMFDIERASPCPFLKDGACAVWGIHPAVCGAYRCDGEDPRIKTNDSMTASIKLADEYSTKEVADLRNWFPESIDDVLSRHQKIAFQFSGGKDSTALLFAMRPYWDRLTVFHLNTGDQHPETTNLVREVCKLVPITFINSDVFKVKREFGLPSDVVPWSSAPKAHECNAGFTPLLQDRVSCCFRTTMEPLHKAMKAAGVTLIIRGQKNRDELKGALASGDVMDGFEFLYPFSDLTDEQCFEILRENSIPIPSYYSEGLVHSGDCLGCTAWNAEESRPDYLRKHFPERFAKYRIEMMTIASATQQAALSMFNTANRCLDAHV